MSKLGKEVGVGVIVSLTLGLFSGCGSSSSDGSTSGAAVCQDMLSHLQACNLASSGDIRASPLLDASSVDRCYVSCFASASCTDLQQSLCVANQPSGALQTCINRCDQFRCGNGAYISIYQKCDGHQDCADGADEQGCVMFTCANGQTIPADQRCDFIPQCNDASDENNCPMLVCADGNRVPESSRCNGTFQCPDGSDEAGCPSFTCANGQTVPQSARCNGVPQCTDRSDENGCPTVARITCGSTTFSFLASFGGGYCY